MTIKASLKHLSERGSEVAVAGRNFLGAWKRARAGRGSFLGLKCIYTRSRLMTCADKPDRTPHSAARDLCPSVLRSQ